MKKMTRVTIGIPAYNEEENLKQLLCDLAAQCCDDFSIDQVHVVSDASSDGTESVVREEKRLPMKLTIHARRAGIAQGLNEILATAQGDVVVILNADVWIKDRWCIAKLIAPILAGRADLTSCNLVALESTSIIGKAVDTSMQIKTRVFENYNGGDNLFCCHGTARAFSARLARKIRFPYSVGEDAYSYLYTKHAGFQFAYVYDTQVHYVVPQRFLDHLRQSRRYGSSKQLMRTIFDSAYLQMHYSLPLASLVRENIHEVIVHPGSCLAYYAVWCVAMLCSLWPGKYTTDAWDIATTSKQVARKNSEYKV